MKAKTLNELENMGFVSTNAERVAEVAEAAHHKASQMDVQQLYACRRTEVGRALLTLADFHGRNTPFLREFADVLGELTVVD